MFDKEKEHRFFGACWAMFNAVRKDNTDEGWMACTKTAHRLCEREENKRFHEKITISLVDEAEREAAMKPEERSAAYKVTGKAYQAAWTLLEELMSVEDFGKNGIPKMVAFNQAYEGRFPKYLSAAVYEFVCKERNLPGSFLEEAYRFYGKYKNGISEQEAMQANEEAENIINVHPAYMLQMMDMYAGLQERARVTAA